MNDNNEIITNKRLNKVMHREESIHDVTEKAKGIGNIFDNLGIYEAKFKNGDYYTNNTATGTKTFVTEGMIIEETDNIYSVTIPKEQYDEKSVIFELEGIKTQKVIGPFLGRDQAWVSNKRNQD